jgi:hypothetical protein
MSLDSLTRIYLGNMGEDLPESEFSEILNLNTLHHNFPIFDHLAKKNNEVYVFSTKARKRMGANGKLNSSYNILYNSSTIGRKFKQAVQLLKENGYTPETLHYCFLIAPMSENTDCKYYWGEFCEINPTSTYENMVNGNERSLRLAIKVKEEDLQTYKVFGVHPWSYIQQKYLAGGSES